MKEIFVNLFKDTKERVSSPFFSSFIFSWSVWNWKIILSLFQESDRIAYISEYLKDEEISICTKLFYPLGAALLYSLLNPFLKRLYDLINAKGSSILSERINTLLRKKINQDDYDIIYYEKFELKERFDKLFKENELLQEKNSILKKEKEEIEKKLSSKTNEFNHLSETNAELSKNYNELKENSKNILKEEDSYLEDELESYLEKIYKDDTHIKVFYSIIKYLETSFDKKSLEYEENELFDYFLDDLKHRSYIEYHSNNNYIFTNEGQILKKIFLNSNEFKKFEEDFINKTKQAPF